MKVARAARGFQYLFILEEVDLLTTDKPNIRFSLTAKITTLIAVIFAVLLVFISAFSVYMQTRQAESEMLEKAQILTQELDASWEFMELNQKRINTDANGNYEFKNLYCAIAGKSIASIITSKTDYVIHYTNLAPRRAADTPDAFEKEALDAFVDNRDLREYYGRSEYEDGTQVFRYVAPLDVTESCLECHGEPKGEIDVTGFPKEGMKIGELGGAISVAMPIDLYLDGISNNIVRQMIAITFFAALCLALVMFAMKRMVINPIQKLRHAAGQVESGRFDIDLGDVGGRDEMRDLASHFESMAQQLNLYCIDLEDQVRSRTTELRLMNEVLESQRLQLEKANELLREENQYKSDFLAIMSHELRTPLTAIIAYTELWEKSDAQKSDSDVETVKEIKESGQLLLQMVNNTLEIARAEAGRNEAHKEPVDMFDVVGTAMNTTNFLAVRKGVELTMDIDQDVPIVEVDWEKARRIVENLVSNAIKFTERGGTVKVHVSYREPSHEVLLEVADDGIGVREEDLPHIFDKFTQVSKSAKRRYNGSGLGLAVVKELVEAHGGRIDVESVYKQGSVFKVYLPVGNGDWGSHDEDNAG